MADAPEVDGSPLTRDAFLGGRLHLRQPAKGHRAGTDAVLLAASVAWDFAGFAYDVGAGVGTAGLCVASIRPACHVGLIENEPLAVRLAWENVEANGLAERVAVSACDVLSKVERDRLGRPADLVVTNPPFYVPGAGRQAIDARRRAAHVSGEGGLAAWIAACLALLTPRGTLILIHRPDALTALLQALDGQAGGTTILPVHARLNTPATRLLVRATKGSRAPTSLAPGLVLHDGDAFTAEADRLHKGDAALTW